MKRTAKMLGMLLVLVFITLTAGCATYPAKGKMPNFNDPSSLNADTKVPTRMGEGIIASAYPLTTKEENEKYFDEDLIESGIFAIFLEIQNENNEGVKLTATNLNFDGGQ
ncbi:MAG: hypothetical protein Q8O94_02240, partial [bacterium]|nr:hypothetical protein [bacterium]